MNAVGRLLLERGAVDHDFVAAHTEGFGAYRDFLLHADWEGLVSAAGVPEVPIRALADRVARSRALLTFYCQGLNQSTVGMWKNNSIINLHLLTGQIGKPGAGPFSLTGQPNAMGAAKPGCWRSSCRVTGSARTPGTAPRLRRTGTPRGDSLDEAGLDGRRDVPGAGSGAAQGDLDRGDQSRGQPPRPASGPARPVRGRTARRPGPLPPDRDDAVSRTSCSRWRSGPRRRAP